jgi:hypothetical protein
MQTKLHFTPPSASISKLDQEDDVLIIIQEILRSELEGKESFIQTDQKPF